MKKAFEMFKTSIDNTFMINISMIISISTITLEFACSIFGLKERIVDIIIDLNNDRCEDEVMDVNELEKKHEVEILCR